MRGIQGKPIPNCFGGLRPRPIMDIWGWLAAVCNEDEPIPSWMGLVNSGFDHGYSEESQAMSRLRFYLSFAAGWASLGCSTFLSAHERLPRSQVDQQRIATSRQGLAVAAMSVLATKALDLDVRGQGPGWALEQSLRQRYFSEAGRVDLLLEFFSSYPDFNLPPNHSTATVARSIRHYILALTSCVWGESPVECLSPDSAKDARGLMQHQPRRNQLITILYYLGRTDKLLLSTAVQFKPEDRACLLAIVENEVGCINPDKVGSKFDLREWLEPLKEYELLSHATQILYILDGRKK